MFRYVSILKDYSFLVALRTLIRLSLVGNDGKSRALSVHRLIRTQFLHCITEAEQQQGLEDGLALLARKLAQDHLQSEYQPRSREQIALIVGHFYHLQERLEMCIRSGSKLHVSQTYFDLAARVQGYVHRANNATSSHGSRYLYDTCNLHNSQVSVDMAKLAFARIPMTQQSLATKALLVFNSGLFAIMAGQVVSGLAQLHESYDCLKQEIAPRSSELSRAATNIANGFGTLNKFSDALSWHKRAREYWKELDSVQVLGRPQLPIHIDLDFGVTHIWFDQLEKSRVSNDLVKQQLESTETQESTNMIR